MSSALIFNMPSNESESEFEGLSESDIVNVQREVIAAKKVEKCSK